MKYKTIYLATDDLNENEVSFENKQDCIEYCESTGYGWHEIRLYYR